MQKDDLVYVGHMLDTARSIVSKAASKSRAEFDANEDLRLALAHLIQTLGEAARRVSPAFQQDRPELPWKQIIGMRHKVVHDYLHVDYDVVGCSDRRPPPARCSVGEDSAVRCQRP